MTKDIASVGESLNVVLTADYQKDICNILRQARQVTIKNINKVMVTAYWLVGERIVKWEQNGNARADYGASILKELSKELTKEFGYGFSDSNLRNMRKFYLTYPDFEICDTLCTKLSWSVNRLIMRVSDPSAREYYLKEAYSCQWSVRQLERNISSGYYQRILANQGTSQKTDVSEEANLRSFIKDPYVLEFLGLPKRPDYSEKELEGRLINNLQKFLLELGKGFSFVGKQYRVSTETTHFYIDLVFYNFILKCFVLIDLKIQKLTHQDIGQMDMYRRMFDDLMRTEGDNPTIGILLCADKDETVVKYSVMQDTKYLFASKFLPYLPSEAELRSELENSYRLLNDSTIEK